MRENIKVFPTKPLVGDNDEGQEGWDPVAMEKGGGGANKVRENITPPKKTLFLSCNNIHKCFDHPHVGLARPYFFFLFFLFLLFLFFYQKHPDIDTSPH